MPTNHAVDDPLLPSPSESSDYEDPLSNAGCAKATTVILIVLFACGILALGLSAIVWNFYDEVDPGHTTTTTSKPSGCGKRIVGYYTDHESKDITKNQLEKLTHVVFYSIQMNSNGTVQFKNPKSQERFLSLRNKSKGVKSPLKVMISIGGQDNSDYFSTVVADSNKHKTFIDSIFTFIKENQIDGVDIYWKWPVESDKFGYATFLKQLNQIFQGRYTLSVVAPPAGVNHWETGFDLDEIIEYVDFVNVYSMDYYGPWDTQYGTPTGPTAPLYSGVGDRKKFNVDNTMQYYVCETKKQSKFNIVVPFYVRLWKNVSDAVESEKEIFRNAQLTDGKAVGSPYMSRRTVESEGLKLTPESWDEETKSAFIYNHNNGTYLTFETERSIIAKLNFIKEMNLGGVWIWSVDMDDDRNSLLGNLTLNSMCSENNNENNIKFSC